MHSIVNRFNRSGMALRDWKEGAIDPLGRHLARTRGLHLYMMGPFGIRAACTIVLYGDKRVQPLKQEHWSITVMPLFNDEDQLEIWYDTFRVVREYPPDSIGAMNNMGNELLSLPDTTKEILALLHHSDGLY